MKQRAYTIRVNEFDSPDQLSEKHHLLVDKAIETSRDAYAPYSDYHVGAALLLENGEVITGNNQENSAYPSGLCAERVALFYAGSQYPGVPVIAIAIAAMKGDTLQEQPVTPCGGCRQVLFETEIRGGTHMEVILFGTLKITVLKRAADLMPLPFLLSSS